MLSSFKPCLNACSATTSLFINASNFVQRYSNRLYLRKLSLYSVVSRILQKRNGHPGDGCRPRHSRRPTDRKESNCTGSCDAEILSHAQMFVQAENRTYFRYYRHKRNTRRPCAISRHSPEAEAREHATAKRPPFSRMHKKAASPSKQQCGLSGCRNPMSPPNGFAGPAGRRVRRIPSRPGYLHSAQITSPGLGASMPGPLGNM